MAQFIKQGNTFYRKDDTGNLYAVSDKDTISGLSSGQLPYFAIGSNRALSFAGETPTKSSSPTPSPAPEQSGGDDIASLIKTKLTSAIKNYAGADTTSLETKRQELLRKQLLSDPYSAEGEDKLTGSQKFSLLRSKGTQFEPEIKAIETEILKAREGDKESIDRLYKLASLAGDIGLLGGGSSYQSGLGKEYADYVADEKSRGNNDVLSFNEYATMDANRKRAVTATEKGLSNSQFAKVTQIASQHDTNPIVKNYSEVQNKAQSVMQIFDSGVGGPGDLAAIFEFMKALDPTSVVRESEYEAASKSGNIFSGWAARFNGYLKAEGGILPEQVKKSFTSIINTKLGVAKKQYDNYHSEQARKINKITGMDDGIEYLTNYGQVDFGGGSDTGSDSGSSSVFSELKQHITIDKSKKEAYIPRSIWSGLGNKMDALLQEAAQDGYILLVK